MVIRTFGKTIIAIYWCENIVVDRSVCHARTTNLPPLVDAEIFHFEGNVVDIDGNIETQFNSEQIIESTMGELDFSPPPNQIKDGEAESRQYRDMQVV